ncbi:MAG TPA: hypothetical protein VFO60_01865 [Candidatus Dormibacteraeota bacterium]|nr:hypothetical protein [Candidatus Dormibacteraeota bacterium]
MRRTHKPRHHHTGTRRHTPKHHATKRAKAVKHPHKVTRQRRHAIHHARRRHA